MKNIGAEIKIGTLKNNEHFFGRIVSSKEDEK